MKCPICEHGSSKVINEVYDDRYGYFGRFRLHRCAGCNHVFLDARFSAQQLSNLYTNYYPRSTIRLEEYCPHKELSSFIAWLDGEHASAFRWVPPNVRVLDIGCGFGETLGYHRARGCDVFGVDLDENIRKVAKRFGYKVHVGLFNPENYSPSSFDYVTMDQVMEHVQDPIKLLCGIAQVLKPGGTAILSVPNANGWGAALFGARWINWHAPYHLQFYSYKSIQLALNGTELTLERTLTATSSAWLYYQWLHLLTYPLEGEPSNFWTHKARYGFFKKMIITFLSIIHYLKINHLITRAFDSINFGDSRLYFLKKNNEQSLRPAACS